MNTLLIQLAMLLPATALVLLIAFRPRIGGTLATLLFLWLGVVEARNGHIAGVCNAAMFGFALGVVPNLSHFDDDRLRSSRKKP